VKWAANGPSLRLLGVTLMLGLSLLKVAVRVFKPRAFVCYGLLYCDILCSSPLKVRLCYDHLRLAQAKIDAVAEAAE
jgi:hypothetical protein